MCRAQSFAERLRLGIAVIHGEAQDAESDQVDGRHSPPTVKTTGAIHPSMEIPCNASTQKLTVKPVTAVSHNLLYLTVSFFIPVLIPKEKPPITVVGDVGGRIAIIVVRTLITQFWLLANFLLLICIGRSNKLLLVAVQFGGRLCVKYFTSITVTNSKRRKRH